MSDDGQEHETSGFDVFISYAAEDERIARALQGELQRLRPGLTVWCEKDRLDLGDALSQEIDEALSQSRMVILLWTPERLMAQSALDEVERALTLQKPALNALIDLEKPNLPAAYGAVRSVQIDAVARLAGRSGGWLPPSAPDREEVAAELRPILEAVDATPPEASRDIAEQIIADLIDAAGEPGETKFDALMAAVARSDRASAVEVMLNAGYSPERINQLMAPKRLVLADTSGSRPAWGAWRIESPPPRSVQGAEEPWPWAVGGFVLAGLLGLGAWLMSSVLGTPETASPNGTIIEASLPVCSIAEDGSIEGGNCRLTVDVPPRTAAQPASPPEPGLQLAACEIASDGAIDAIPCRLEQAVTPRPPASDEGAPDGGDDTLDACTIAESGAIGSAPCRLEADYTPPEGAPLPACTRLDNGAVTNVPCRVNVPMPPMAPAAADPAPRTVSDALPACPPARPGETLRADCRLLRPIVVAHARCDSDLSNVPCALMEAPQLASAIRPPPSGASAPEPDPAPREPLPELPPIPVPDELEPCETRKRVPCRLTVANTGLGSLTEIAESYYGSVRGYCRIFRANPDVFGTRNDPRTPSNPNCIFLEDVLDLPGFPEDMVFSTTGCPRPQPRNECVRP